LSNRDASVKSVIETMTVALAHVTLEA